MSRLPAAALVVLSCLLGSCAFGRTAATIQPGQATCEDALGLPAVGTACVRVLGPRFVEVRLITAKDSGRKPRVWDWVDAHGREDLPKAGAFEILAGDARILVKAVGFRRRVAYAASGRWDLRLDNRLILELATPLKEGSILRLKGEDAWNGWLQARTDPSRRGPALHVDPEGFVPDFPKHAYVGYWMGSLGEMPVEGDRTFRVVEEATGRKVFEGSLVPRVERGFDSGDRFYTRMFEADFSALKTPGRYRVEVSGLGATTSFRIDDGVAALFARTLAAGMVNQRCGAALGLPFTRFGHAACHVAPAEVPTAAYAKVQDRLAGFQSGANPEGQGAPILDSLDKALFPPVRTGTVDVSGGHHDAGDYGKYTVFSALTVHALVFAADAFPGAGDLDNLGTPESGDGRSDLVQMARWEADFLAKMQDSDGGFFFLVQPKNRPYEDDVPPERGDTQVVFPKNTSATAAAVAALAQAGSSPRMMRDFPADAARYLDSARKGWDFLKRAFAKHGRYRAYQRVTHYGERFEDKDEVAWAATEMFLASGDAEAHRLLQAEFDPADPKTRWWGWIRMADSYGAAIRSYAFAARMRRVPADRLDPAFLAKCEAEIRAMGAERVSWASDSAYRTSFPEEHKRFGNAGWHFSAEAGFDLAAAWALDAKTEFIGAAVTSLDWMAGANPNDVTFLPGLGLKRPREMVSQYARNDERALPPTGIPGGDAQAGFGWLPPYGKELGGMTWPQDGKMPGAFPLFDRWADTWNVQTEIVTATLARCLGGAAWLMARTPAAGQAWRGATGRIEGVPARLSGARTVTARLVVDGMDVSKAELVWEARGVEPASTREFTFTAKPPGWVEAEAVWPDGRRVSARAEFGEGD
jgi:hypothetical protein